MYDKFKNHFILVGSHCSNIILLVSSPSLLGGVVSQLRIEQWRGRLGWSVLSLGTMEGENRGMGEGSTWLKPNLAPLDEWAHTHRYMSACTWIHGYVHVDIWSCACGHTANCMWIHRHIHVDTQPLARENMTSYWAILLRELSHDSEFQWYHWVLTWCSSNYRNYVGKFD
jgi:hypothetical protein